MKSINNNHVIIVFTWMLITFIPIQATTQEEGWKPNKAVAVVKEYAKSLAAVQASNAKRRPENAPGVSCDPLRLSAFVLSVKRGEDNLVLQTFRPCDQPIPDSLSFSYKSFDGVEGYDGWMYEDGERYVLLDGKMTVELTSPSFPLEYTVSFKARFATEADRERFLKGQPLPDGAILTAQGDVVVKPHAECNSKLTGYRFDSRKQRMPDPAEGHFCFPLFGVQAPPTPKPQPTKTPSP